MRVFRPSARGQGEGVEEAGLAAPTRTPPNPHSHPPPPTAPPLQRVEYLQGRQPNEDWWALELPLPELLFKVDYVVMDAESGAVDNNK